MRVWLDQYRVLECQHNSCTAQVHSAAVVCYFLVSLLAVCVCVRTRLWRPPGQLWSVVTTALARQAPVCGTDRQHLGSKTENTLAEKALTV